MRPHRFDAISFGFGIVIAAVGFWLISGHVDITDLRLTWVWPIPLIVLGLLMLISARRREGEDRAEVPIGGPPDGRAVAPGSVAEPDSAEPTEQLGSEPGDRELDPETDQAQA